MSEASSSGERTWHVFEVDIALGCWSVTENENGDSFIEAEGFHSRSRDDIRLSYSVIPKVFIAGIRIYKDRERTPLLLTPDPDLDDQGDAIGTITVYPPVATRINRLSAMEVYVSINMKGSSWERMARLVISGQTPPWNLRAKARFSATRPHPEDSVRVQGHLIEASFIYDKSRPIFSVHDLSRLAFSFLCQSFPPRATTSTEANPLKHPQFRQILLELTRSALNSFNENGQSLQGGFHDALSIAHRVWGGLRNIHARNMDYRQSRQLKPSDISEGWKKRSPQSDLAFGDESRQRIEVNVSDFVEIADIYFASSLRSSTVEYIIADGLMYADLQAFSRSIIRGVPGARSYELSLPDIPESDWLSLSKVSKRLFWRRLPLTSAYWIAAFFAPLGYAAYAFHEHGWVGVAVSTLWLLAMELLRRASARLDILGRKSEADNYKKMVDLFSIMRKAYLRVLPGAAPEDFLPAIKRSAKAGASWNPLALKIIMRYCAEFQPPSPFNVQYAIDFSEAVDRWADKNNPNG